MPLTPLEIGCTLQHSDKVITEIYARLATIEQKTDESRRTARDRFDRLEAHLSTRLTRDDVPTTLRPGLVQSALDAVLADVVHQLDRIDRTVTEMATHVDGLATLLARIGTTLAEALPRRRGPQVS